MLPTPLNSVPQETPPPPWGGEGVQRRRPGRQRALTSKLFKPYHLKTLNLASTAKLVKMCEVTGTVNLTNSTAAGSHTKHRRQQVLVTQSAMFTTQIIQIRQAARSSAEGDAEGELCEVFSKSKNRTGDPCCGSVARIVLLATYYEKTCYLSWHVARSPNIHGHD